MFVLDVAGRVVDDVVATVVADWPYLLASVAAATALTVYVGTDRSPRGFAGAGGAPSRGRWFSPR